MTKDKIKEYLIHPAFLTFILWLVVILVLPPLFPRYRIKHIKDEYTTTNSWYIYADFDSDGNSERISFDLNDAGQTKIIISRDNRVLNQYNLRYQTVKFWPTIFIDDINHDGFKEFFVHTMSDDSIFLNIIDPLKSRKIILKDRFIEKRNKVVNSTDIPQFNPVGTIECGSDTKDFIFFIATGYSLQPRNVYRYSISKDSLLKSPASGAVIRKCQIFDITNDSRSEILMDVDATGNLGESFPFTDQYSWLMVLDENMQFLFPPVQFSENPSRVLILPLKQNDQMQMVVFCDYFGTENIKSAFYLFDNEGTKIGEKTIEDYEGHISRIFANDETGGLTFFFLRNNKAEIDEIDISFNILKTISIGGIDTYYGAINEIDADLDGSKEYIFKGEDMRSLVFIQNNFRYPVSWQYTKNTIENPIISHVLKKDSKPILYLQFSDHGSYIRFEKNIFYYLRYPFYVSVYLAILSFIFLISRIQQYRLVQKQVTEKKIASLQMKSIKNQIDPHFTLNVLNAIGSLYATEKNRDRADYIFGKYARLIRQTVVSSDQIIVTLAEELDFVKNYVEIEQFRSENTFEYKIDIDESVDRQTKIPRMLIHTFVENAIKYGVRNRDEGGLLRILVKQSGNKIRITVEDNGPGIDQDEKSKSGTGRGLAILDELIELYFKVERSKITYSLENITSQGNQIFGTKALIEMPA